MDEIRDDEVRFTMRMEKELYELLKDSAKENRRSIAKELEYITDLHLRAHSRSVPLPEELNQKFIEFVEEYFKKKSE